MVWSNDQWRSHIWTQNLFANGVKHMDSSSNYSNRSNLKIVHVSPRYFLGREMGGGERYSLELTKALSKYADTTLLTFGKRRETTKLKDLCIETYPVESIFQLFLKLSPSSASFLQELKDADLIHIHHLRNTLSSFSIVYGKLKGKRVFITDHGGRDTLGRWLALFTGRLASCFLTVSGFSAKELRWYGKVARIIYGGVDVAKFYPRNLEKNEKRILFVGRFLPHKGCEYLVKAVQDLNVELHLVGPPVNRAVVSSLKALDKKRKVKFMFCLSDEDLSNEYSESLVTVLPSVYKDYYGKFHRIPELLGLALLESMACGTTVLCTRVGGMPEIVRDYETGLIVDPNDPNGLREKIEYLLNNLEEAKNMGRRGRNIILKKYTWDAVAKRCLTAYNEFDCSR